MTTTTAPNDPIRAAVARRLAEVNAMPKYTPAIPARRDIIRTHKHSVKGRSIR